MSSVGCAGGLSVPGREPDPSWWPLDRVDKRGHDGRVPVIAHLSDLHVGGPWSPADRARRVLAHLVGYDPPVDVVVLTGDLAEHGSEQEYAEVAALLAQWPGPGPVLTCPGNHDVRTGYAALRGLPGTGPVNEAHRVAGALFLMLDSMVPAPPGQRIDHGHLAPETLAWLDAELSAPERGSRPSSACTTRRWRSTWG